jgi:hypothetical protein
MKINDSEKTVLFSIAVNSDLTLLPKEVVNVAQSNVDKGYCFQTVVKQIKILGI